MIRIIARLAMSKMLRIYNQLLKFYNQFTNHIGAIKNWFSFRCPLELYNLGEKKKRIAIAGKI